MSVPQAIGHAMWLMGSVILGSTIAQLFMAGQTKFGILVSVAAFFTVLGGAMKAEY